MVKRLLLVLFLLTGAAFAADLRFAQVSDVHYMNNGVNNYYKFIGESPRLLDDAIGQINQTPELSFVVFTGDMVDQPREAELKGFLSHIQTLEYPWHFAPGNHDVGKTMSRAKFLELTGGMAPYYTFIPKKGFRVIVLDSVTPLENGSSGGQIGKEQLQWLDEQLACAGKDVVLIFMHHTLCEPFASPNHRMSDAAEVIEVLHRYKNPIAVFAGHYHACGIVQDENVLYVNSPSLVTYPNAFRVVDVNAGIRKVVFNIQLRETGLKNLQKTAKIFLGTAPNAGEEKDRNAIVEIVRK